MDVLAYINKWLWVERIWLPGHLSWDNFKNSADQKFAQPQDFITVVPLAMVVFCIRIILERAVAMRIGLWLRLPHASVEPVKKYNPRCIKDGVTAPSAPRRHSGKPTKAKSAQGKSSILIKFSETFWRFMFYFTMFCYGGYALYDEECVWNREMCWHNFPSGHQLNSKMYWYYMIEMAFYVATTATQFFDVRRKDFWEMFVHHIMTILLMFGSYSMNYTKIGCVILIVHDSADFYLEFAKMGKYANHTATTNIGFLLFTLAFFVSRLLILPFWVIPTIWEEGLRGHGVLSVIYFLFCALLVLQVLHFYWFSHIVRVLYSTLTIGEVGRDTRSDSEDSQEAVCNSHGDGSGHHVD